MRRLLALALLITSLACGCAAGLAAPAALAAGSSGTPLTGSSGVSPPSFGLSSGGAATTPAVTTATPVVSTTSSAGGLSTLDGVVIGVVVVLLLGGVAFWIWYDARGHVARARHGDHDDALFSQRAHSGSKTPRKPRKHKPAERKRRKRGRAR